MLRKRIPEKEVGYDKIKHKPANSLERINDQIFHNSLESYVGDGKAEPQTNKNSRINLNSPLGVKNPGHYSRLSLEEKGGVTTIVSPKQNFLPELHRKTHFNAAQALMMQYPKSSLKYEGDQLNRELGRGPLFPAPKANQKFARPKGSNSTVNEVEEFGGDVTSMSKTIGSIFNKTGNT